MPLTDLCPLVTVSSLPGVGRCALAARDIEAGELVMEDEAVMVSPGGGRRLCLECGAGVTEEVTCQQCGLPVCCSGTRHKAECCFKLQFPTHTSRHLGVAIVRLVKALESLSEEESWKREEVGKLMSHLDSRSCDSDIHDIVTVVDCILPALGDKYSREQLLTWAGVIMTNTASCNSVPGGEDVCIGLFPVFSLLSHSCVANTRRETDGGRMKVIATIPIPAGAQIFTSYKNPLLGSVSRRAHFPRVWYFHCECRRCCDPSELGSHLSSLSCGQCGGDQVPAHPLSYHSPWRCVRCQHTLSCHQAMSVCVRMYRALVSCPDSAPHILGLISHLETIAHRQHYVTIQAKMKFVMLTNVTDEKILTQQVFLAKEILSVLDIVEPGLTKRRGQILKVMAVTKLKLMKLNPPGPGLQMMMEMKGMMLLLREVAKCKQWDSEGEKEEWAKTMKQMMMFSSPASQFVSNGSQ